ncbi:MULTISPECIES: RNA polymerase sigma factor [unclassified Pseudomonas]|uniref:RNA polymerase sigma factor n=1 Tax=unclassified Pseudomonas TaxID=196821 RepID=UPI0023613333|nr:MULTISPECIES: RNA polymerase sigma factor [unclassified Pseudomonas]
MSQKRIFLVSSLPPSFTSGESPTIVIQQLAAEHRQKLRAFVHKRVLNAADADDIVQSTYLEAWRNREKFSGLARPETWLCGIALNLIRNHFRRFYAQPQLSPLEDVLHWNDDLDVSQQCEHLCLLNRTLDAMEDLPFNMRETLHRAIESEGSYQETAEYLGVPIGTVRSRLSRAREQLKRDVYGELRV